MQKATKSAGRPTVYDEPRRQISVVLTEATIRKIDKHAKAQGISRTAAIEQLLSAATK